MADGVNQDPCIACTDLGGTIPDTAHVSKDPSWPESQILTPSWAVSVSLPSWAANVGYEEGQNWVVEKMQSGYPRFFIHPSIQNFADILVQSFGYAGQIGFLFPNSDIARQCLDFVRDRVTSASNANGGQRTSSGEEAFKVVVFDVRNAGREKSIDMDVPSEGVLAAAFVPETLFSIGKQFWQHSGEGVSSRRAEFLHQAFQAGYLVTRNGEQRGEDRPQSMKGPKRYQKDPLRKVMTVQDTASAQNDGIDYARFVEERFGRNLDASLEKQAKLAVRKRIAGAMNDNIQSRDKKDASTQAHAEVATVSEDDIYLYPSGMSSIFNSHQLLMKVRGAKKSVMFGFPYIDTLKILEKFGPGALFYGQGSALDLDDLESRCSRGEEFLALYCEFPGNPLLKTPDVWRIRKLADQYGFAVVVDETIGNFLNVHVLPAADIIVSSLTKVFSGDSNVMGGSLTLNPKSRFYHSLQTALKETYRDNYWPEDAIFMERNSRDFVSRNERINRNAEALCRLLRDSPLVKQVYYPLFSDTRPLYEAMKTPNGGYGGLFSVTFHVPADAHAFFDALKTEKGPSLGTNFTLSCPFIILAHYNELEWAAEFGAEADLVRVSVGLEDTEKLSSAFQCALDLVQAQRTNI